MTLKSDLELADRIVLLEHEWNRLEVVRSAIRDEAVQAAKERMRRIDRSGLTMQAADTYAEWVRVLKAIARGFGVLGPLERELRSLEKQMADEAHR